MGFSFLVLASFLDYLAREGYPAYGDGESYLSD